MNKAAVLFVIFFAPAIMVQPQCAIAATDVHVDNFPDTQQVKGSVSIEGPIINSKYVKKEGLLVPISRRGELAEMLHGGIVEAEGYTSIAISLQGEIKSSSFTSGAIGVVLVPDEDPVLRALREAKLIQFPIECAAQIKSGALSFFSAEPIRAPLIFPRYRLYLYNTLNKTADANVYIQLSN